MTGPSEIHEHDHRYRANSLRAGLWWLAAAQRDALEHPLSAGNRLFYDALGMTVGLTGLADAVIGGATAREFIFHGSTLLGVVAGGLWGSAVIILDRMLLAGMDALHEATLGRKRAIAAFRIAAATIIASANAVPAECLLFKSRIDVQVAENRTAETVREESLLAQSYADLPSLQNQRAALDKESTDAETAASQAAHDMIVEDDGRGGSGIPGDGARHKEKEGEFHRLERQAAGVRTENTPKIASLDREIHDREAQRDAELGQVRQTIDASDDPLTRFEALADLKADSRHGPVVQAAGWLFMLVSVLFGVGPVLAKLLRSANEYDALLGARRETARAHWRSRTEIASTEMASDVEEHRAEAAARVSLTERLAQEAVEEAAASPAGRSRKRAFAKEILDPAVAAARKAAREAFDPDLVARDVREAAEAARRRQSEQIIQSERRRAAAFEELEAAERLAASLREPPPLEDHELH